MLKKFPLVHIRFHDHVQGPPEVLEPIICDVFGILSEETDLAYRVISWVAEDNLSSPNSEGYSILKTTVVEKKEITRNGK